MSDMYIEFEHDSSNNDLFDKYLRTDCEIREELLVVKYFSKCGFIIKIFVCSSHE